MTTTDETEHPITPTAPTESSLTTGELNPSSNGVSQPAKKQAIVVYEGDERWQPPRQLGFADADDGSDEDRNNEDEASSASGSDAEHGDLLAEYPSDSEVRLSFYAFYFVSAHHLLVFENFLTYTFSLT